MEMDNTEITLRTPLNNEPLLYTDLTESHTLCVYNQVALIFENGKEMPIAAVSATEGNKYLKGSLSSCSFLIQGQIGSENFVECYNLDGIQLRYTINLPEYTRCWVLDGGILVAIINSNHMIVFHEGAEIYSHPLGEKFCKGKVCGDYFVIILEGGNCLSYCFEPFFIRGSQIREIQNYFKI